MVLLLQLLLLTALVYRRLTQLRHHTIGAGNGIARAALASGHLVRTKLLVHLMGEGGHWVLRECLLLLLFLIIIAYHHVLKVRSERRLQLLSTRVQILAFTHLRLLLFLRGRFSSMCGATAATV